MEVIELNPQTIRFTHDSIFHIFKNGVRLSDTISDLENNLIKVEDFPMIRVVLHKGCYWSLDNRRLYVFKVSCTVPHIMF